MSYRFVKRQNAIGWDWYLELDDCSSWVSQLVKYVIESLESDNAKLRELVRDMGELLDVLTECDLACKHYHEGCISDCYYVNARRELGVGVDG